MAITLMRMMSCNLRASSLFLVWLLTLVYSFQPNSCSLNSTNVLCLETERRALLHFKQDLIVPSTCLISWTASQLDCCKWDEVVCDDFTGHIKELHLQNPYDLNYESNSEMKNFEMSKLQGKINPCLLELKYLEYLDLSYNDFGGIPIPNFFGSMVSLTYLNISYASFQGLIPYQLGNLSNLQYLSISGYDLYVKNLHWLKNLSSLVHLHFEGANMSGLSYEWLGIMNSLPSLKELHLYDSQLAFPSWHTVNFTSLSVLHISYNYFVNASIPKWILSLSKLKSLELRENGFTGPIPNGMSNLSSLSNLNLNDNFLTSPSPDWLFGLKNLSSLSLARNEFGNLSSTNLQNQTSLKHLELPFAVFPNNTIPQWLYKFPHLESLDISSAYLRGQISGSIQNLSALAILDLSYNELEGAIPKSLISLCHLNEIHLSNNKLTGEISKALESISSCSSRNLQAIDLGNNKFSGSLSDSFQRLPSLINLDLSYNQLVGNIPQSLGTLSDLQILRIDNNMLEGIVSEVHFRNLTKLIDLRASNNNLTLKVDSNWVPPFQLKVLELRCWSIGPQFPSWIETQHDLQLLDLSCTGISDPFPSWFWNSSSQLVSLNLSHNQISGELPSVLNAKIQYYVGMFIFLSSNRFVGQLPQISGDIVQLDLFNNSLSGSTSVLLCNPLNQANKLFFLNLGGNNLSGDIPDCWKYWQSLGAIILENNQLTGNIPNSISHLAQLQSLHLRNNKLSGEIPVSLQNCSMLKALDFGFNYIDGKLPTWLGSLAKLIILALPANKLEGEIPSKFCNLIYLQVLDISANNLSGSIPTCINNLTAMSSVDKIESFNLDIIDYVKEGSIDFRSFIENIFVVVKGRGDKYDSILQFVTTIDISSNNLSGYIPREITALSGLHFLNLSGNEFIGDVPINIGDMQALESFDLSRNQISGQIPQSMSTMHFLSYLNVSCNSLSGEIPLGTQLQSFNPSSFVGNKLCGPPLTVNCSVHAMPPKVSKGSHHGGGGTKVEGFYVAMVIGFVVGFWGICGPLLYSRPWRISYYSFLNTMWCRLYVKWQLMWRMYRRG